jgi:methanogenic corrinoid protein MtbC1
VLVPTLSDVGRQFQAFDIFLPELMAAGDAGQAATQILEAAIATAGRESASLGTIVLGTVQNDIHDIGKNIVKTLLSSHGFKVIDIGRDVARANSWRRPSAKADIVAMSALMTTTRPATRSTINLFTEAGARPVQMIIGAAASTWPGRTKSAPMARRGWRR